jgi:amino acid transporter
MKNRSPVDPSVILFKGVGTWDAIAIAVAGMAPTMAMNLNPQEPAEHVGRVVPLVFALSTVVVLLVAWCFARLARDHPNAGSAYGFVAAKLGSRAGLVAGWTLLGTYLCFAIVGLGAFGLFGANLLQRANLWHDASSFSLTAVAALVVGPLSIIPARRAGLVLIILEGIAVVAMLLMACAVLLLVLQGHGPQGDPPLRDLFIPTAGVGASSIAMGLSFGLLSFAGFEQVATLGEEVRKSRFTIPRVLIGSVLGAGFVFTVVTAAETLGFGTDAAGVVRFTTSTSLLADLSARYFGAWSGDLFDGLAICSALGGALASIVASSRILFALCRDLVPSSRVGRISEASGTPRNAALCVLFDSDHGIWRNACHLSCVGIRCFFLGLQSRSPCPPHCLFARGRQCGRRSHSSVGEGNAMDSVDTLSSGSGDHLYPLGKHLRCPAWRLSGDTMDCPRLVLCTHYYNVPQSRTSGAHYVRCPGREHQCGLPAKRLELEITEPC